MATEAQTLSREMILPAYKAAVIYVPIRGLYNCRESSTNQAYFMQNKANVKIGKMNASCYTIKDYDKKQRTINNERYSKQSQNKPNSNPIKACPERSRMGQFQSRNAKKMPHLPACVWGLRGRWVSMRGLGRRVSAKDCGSTHQVTACLRALAQWSAFLGRKKMPGPTPSGYGTRPSAVMETFIGTTSEAEYVSMCSSVYPACSLISGRSSAALLRDQ